MKRSEMLAGAGVAIWLLAVLLTTRYYMLDDALIHLRYASHLQSSHQITYNGGQQDYGTSSVLYVCLLAGLRWLTSSPLLPKLVSVAFYLLLVVGVAYKTLRSSQNKWGRTLGVSLLVVLLSPMAVRWLTDGMETGFVLFLVGLLAIFGPSLIHQTQVTFRTMFLLALYGFLLVLARVELCLLVAMGAIIVAGPDLLRSCPERKIALARACSLIAGAGLAVIGITLYFHHLLPDTAVAKIASGKSLETLSTVFRMTASSFAFGVGLTAIYLTSAVIALKYIRASEQAREKTIVWIAANASYPILVSLACLRGQYIQGIRYLIWPLGFSVLWNIVTIQANSTGDFPVYTPYLRKWQVAFLGMLVCLLPFDTFFGFHSMMGRSAAFLKMRQEDLSRFSNSTIIAGDVGFIGYFTQGTICDTEGLVNGRNVAELSILQRYERCAASKPAVLFVTDAQREELSRYMDFSRWSTCFKVNYQNVDHDDTHSFMLPGNCERLPEQGQ
ncbi:MAG: hypothetical protein JSS95_05060 [Acidobacteria bacterium]|nr:hypothetical protein [Acidobacteriota bacterium]